jgi:hypothetical protein
MANDTSTGYASDWNNPGINGDVLLNFSAIETPFLSRVSGVKVSTSDKFAMSAIAASEADTQSAVTEADSQTAPTAVAYDLSNEENVIQIMHRKVNLTYKNISDSSRLKFVESGTSGYAYTSDPLTAANNEKLAFQVTMAQTSLNRELEKSALYGTYQVATSAAVANKMRGIITACTTNTVAAGGSELDQNDHIDALLQEMAATGAYFSRVVIFANAFQKKMLSRVYDVLPADRNLGGSNIMRVETDFGTFEIVYDRHMPTDTILFADMAYVSLVRTPVPGKTYIPGGFWTLEDKSSDAAAITKYMYGQNSIDYGSGKLHGTITGLATS